MAFADSVRMLALAAGGHARDPDWPEDGLSEVRAEMRAAYLEKAAKWERDLPHLQRAAAAYEAAARRRAAGLGLSQQPATWPGIAAAAWLRPPAEPSCW